MSELPHGQKAPFPLDSYIPVLFVDYEGNGADPSYLTKYDLRFGFPQSHYLNDLKVQLSRMHDRYEDFMWRIERILDSRLAVSMIKIHCYGEGYYNDTLDMHPAVPSRFVVNPGDEAYYEVRDYIGNICSFGGEVFGVVSPEGDNNE